MTRFLQFAFISSSVFLFVVTGSSFPLLAQVSNNNSMLGISERLERLAGELELIEKEEQELLKRQDETITAIKNLKIVTHK